MPRDMFFVLFVGAGGINFGSPEGPWNHSERLEKVVGDRLRVVGIIDPDLHLAKRRIEAKIQHKKESVQNAYKETKCFATISDAIKSGLDKQTIVHLIINGAPPHVRGTCMPGKDLDLQLINAFPKARAIFVEKPVSASDPKQVDCDSVAKMYKQFNGIVGVGYVLRYLNVVQKLKSILDEHKIVPMCINARYIMAYEFTTKLHWWNMDISCGPIVEQATHFVDLIRYLAGSSIQTESITAKTVNYSTPAGQLSKIGIDEDAFIPPSKRIPRVTVSSWTHEKGTISNLMHGVALHGQDYSTEIDIVADGWLLRLSDLYQPKPKLALLKEGEKEYSIIQQNDDPFFTELNTIVQAIDQEDSKIVLSSYEDALETYKLTWNIRKAGEGYSHSHRDHHL